MRTVISLILFAVTMAAGGQSGTVVSVYSTQQGLPSNVVRGIDEDLDGGLWVSTDNGLCLFRNPSAPERGIVVMKRGGSADDKHPVSNDQNMIYADRHAPILWIATRSDGLDAYHYRTNTFVHYPARQSSSHETAASSSQNAAVSNGKTIVSNGKTAISASPTLHDASVTSIVPDGNRTLWLTSWMGGFTCMDKLRGQFYHFDRRNLPQLPCDSCWCILPLPVGDRYPLSSENESPTVSRFLAVGHVNHGLTLIDLKTSSCRNYPIISCFKAGYAAEDGVRSMVRDGRGNLWMGTEKGLAVFDMKRRKAVEVPEISGLVNHLSLQGDTILASTRDMGLLSISVSDYYRHPNAPTIHQIGMGSAKLSASLAVNTSLVDRSGQLWLGSQEEGLLLVRRNSLWFFPLDMPPTVQDNVTALLALSAEDVWIGTFQKGLFRWNPHTGECRSVTLVDANGGRRIFVNGLALWQGRVAVATGQGLFLVEPETSRYRCLSHKELRLSSDYILALATDRWGQLWCSSLNDGIRVYDCRLQLRWRIDRNALHTSRAVAHLCPILGDRMAGTTGSGLLLIRQDKAGRPILPISPDSIGSSPQLSTIHTLCSDAENRLLCFTPGGIFRLENGAFTPLYPCLYNEQQANLRTVTRLSDGSILWYGNRSMGVMSYNDASCVLPSDTLFSLVGILAVLTLLVLVAICIFALRRRSIRKANSTSSQSSFEPSQSSLAPSQSSLAPSQSSTSPSGIPTEAIGGSLSAEDNALIRRLEDTVARMESLEALSRDSLAQEMCMSTSTLYRRMKQVLGLSPNEWIRIRRLERARKLLKSGRNVSETAILVGLDSAYLARCYKEHYGVYPSEEAFRTADGGKPTVEG